MATNPFGNISHNFVRSPLGIIALFIVLVYAMAGIVATFGPKDFWLLLILVTFLVVFPFAVLRVFYLLVTKYPEFLFGPGDFEREENFLRLRGLADNATDVLSKFWMPDGLSVDTGNRDKLVDWMRDNDLGGVSITVFLRADIYKEARQKAVQELNLQTG